MVTLQAMKALKREADRVEPIASFDGIMIGAGLAWRFGASLTTLFFRGTRYAAAVPSTRIFP